MRPLASAAKVVDCVVKAAATYGAPRADRPPGPMVPSWCRTGTCLARPSRTSNSTDAVFCDCPSAGGVQSPSCLVCPPSARIAFQLSATRTLCAKEAAERPCPRLVSPLERLWARTETVGFRIRRGRAAAPPLDACSAGPLLANSRSSGCTSAATAIRAMKKGRTGRRAGSARIQKGGHIDGTLSRGTAERSRGLSLPRSATPSIDSRQSGPWR
jgi:hypothetical protein